MWDEVYCLWDEVIDVDGYNVYYREEGVGEFEKINEDLITEDDDTSNPKFRYNIIPARLNSLPVGTYELYVTSVKDGNESEPSNIDTMAVTFGW